MTSSSALAQTAETFQGLLGELILALIQYHADGDGAERVRVATSRLAAHEASQRQLIADLVFALEDTIAFMTGDISGDAQKKGIIEEARAVIAKAGGAI
jgi:hypothetical protein